MNKPPTHILGRAPLQKLGLCFFLLSMSSDGALASQEVPAKLSGPSAQEVEVDFGTQAVRPTSLATHPSQSVAAFGLRDGRVRSFNVATGESLASWKAGTGAISRLAYSPDGGVLATFSSSDAIRLWGTKSWDLQGEIKLVEEKEDRWFSGIIQFSADGTRFVVSFPGEATSVWKTDDWTLAATIQDQDYPVLALAWSDDGMLLASMTEAGNAYLWSASTGELLGGPLEHDGLPGSDVAFRPGTHELAASCRGLLVRVWNADEFTPLYDIPHPHLSQDPYWIGVEYSPDGKQLMTTHEAGYIRCWNSDDGSRQYEIDYWGGNHEPFVAHYVAGGSQILVDGNAWFHVGLVDAKEGTRLLSLDGKSLPLRLTGDGTTILAQGYQSIQVIDSKTGVERYSRAQYKDDKELILTPALYYTGSSGVDALCQIKVGGKWGPLLRHREQLMKPKYVLQLAAGEKLERPTLKGE